MIIFVTPHPDRFRVGMTPANASAAIAALEILRDEPARVAELKQKALSSEKCRQAKLNVGESQVFCGTDNNWIVQDARYQINCCNMEQCSTYIFPATGRCGKSKNIRKCRAYI